jgi:hypothetical protein
MQTRDYSPKSVEYRSNERKKSPEPDYRGQHRSVSPKEMEYKLTKQQVFLSVVICFLQVWDWMALLLVSDDKLMILG